MYKLLIADDEARIRRGLKNSLNWQELNIEILAEAEDGEVALSIAKEIKPDIMLVDINMPFLNGLELIKRLNVTVEDCIIIIITGHDEFKYMHEALKLKVFDYILKPVNKQNLKETIEKAIQELGKIKSEKTYREWTNKALDENVDALKEKFLDNLLKGRLPEEQTLKELKFLKINLSKNLGLFIVKISERMNIESSKKSLDNNLKYFAVINITLEMLLEFEPVASYIDEDNNIIILTNKTNNSYWKELSRIIEDKIYLYLHYNVIVLQDFTTEGVVELPSIYKKITAQLKEKSNYKPMVLLLIKYIQNNYFVNDLSLEHASEKFSVSSSYLSKLLKQETGLSFIDYLTKIRIENAIKIMEDPAVKLYEVAELVGYSNQHYFSKAFKKLMGIPPTEYKSGFRGGK